MVATVHCEEIANENFSKLVSDEVLGHNVEMILQYHAGLKSETVQNPVLRKVSRSHFLFRLKYVIYCLRIILAKHYWEVVVE